MARVEKTKGSGGKAHFNMTPMIDITFLLIVFFMLVAQFQQLAIEKVTLPAAEESISRTLEAYHNVVINVVKKENQDKAQIIIRGKPYNAVPEEGNELVQFLEMEKAKAEDADKQINIILRSDAEARWRMIARVMLCAGRAQISRWWVTVKPEEETS